MFNTDIREDFREAWSYYDQNATSYVNKEDFPDLMLTLKQPLGWDHTFQGNIEK